MKKFLLLALLGMMALGAKSQDKVNIVSDISSGPGKNGSCTEIVSLTFTLVDPVHCDYGVVTVTVYPPLGGSFAGQSYTNVGLGYPGYEIIAATALPPSSASCVPTTITAGDYMTPMPCSLTPYMNSQTTGSYPAGPTPPSPGCQYGIQWSFGTPAPTGTALIYLT